MATNNTPIQTTQAGIPPAQSPFVTNAGQLGPGIIAGPTFGGGSWGGQSLFSQQGMQDITNWLNQQGGGQATPAPAQPPAAPQFSNPTAQAYFTQYPDVAAAYSQNSFGLSPDDFAMLHYQKFGQGEQRAWGQGSQTTNPLLSETIPRPTQPSRGAEGIPAAPSPYQTNSNNTGSSQMTSSNRMAPTDGQMNTYLRDYVIGLNGNNQTIEYLMNNPDAAYAYSQNSGGKTPDQYVQALRSGQSSSPAQAPVAAPAPAPAQQGQYTLAMFQNSPGKLATFANSLDWGGGYNAKTNPEGYSARQYFLQNPDVAFAYSQNTYGMSPVEFAKAHYANFGRQENRQYPKA